MRSFCEGTIAHFKVPKHIRVVTEMPMTVTGKPQKFVMRQRMLELLGKRGREDRQINRTYEIGAAADQCRDGVGARVFGKKQA